MMYGLTYPMAHAVSTSPQTFAEKLQAELARRTAANGQTQGARTVARLMVAANPSRDLEQTRRSIRRYLKGDHVPTQVLRDEITDALGMERGSLDPDAEEEEDPAMLLRYEFERRNRRNLDEFLRAQAALKRDEQ